MANKFVHPEDAMRAKILGELRCQFCTHLSPKFVWCKFFDPRLTPVKDLLTHYCEQFQHNPIQFIERDHGPDKR